MILTPLEAAELIQADYRGELGGVIESLDLNGVQASIVAVGHRADKPVLLIRGSDERCDWVRNFTFAPVAGPGDQFMWHAGFLMHAQIAYAFAKGKPLSMVIGHSLGGACTELVGAALDLPYWAFGAPRALYAPDPGSPRPLNIKGTVFWRTDDLVCRLPPGGFVWVAPDAELRPTSRHRGEDHRIPHYIALLKTWTPAA